MPGQACRGDQPKWSVMGGFPKGEHLYNYHTALRSPSRAVLLVEGPGDVWRAEEAGFLAVAMLGLDLSAKEVRKLSELGKSVLLALDNDKAGRDARLRMQESLWGRVPAVSQLFLPPQFHDLGDMPVGDAARWLSSCVTP